MLFGLIGWLFCFCSFDVIVISIFLSLFLGKCFFFSSRRRHTRLQGDWSSDVCSSDLSGSSVAVVVSLASAAATAAAGSCCRYAPTIRRAPGWAWCARNRRRSTEDSSSEERRVGKEGK